MASVFFCKTRYQDIGYHSYNDFWRLVELSGYPTIYVDQIDPQSDNTYIITPLNGEWLNGWQQPKARIIHWELEWRTDWRADVNEPPGVAEVWASDKWYAGHINARYVPVGGNANLNEVGVSISKQFDVSLLSYQTHRRQKITAQLENVGLKLAPISNLWGRYRSEVLVESRAMVHVHQHNNVPGIAPLRWCLAAAHRVPVISESIRDYGIFDFRYTMQARYGSLASFAKSVTNDNFILRDYADSLHYLLCEAYTFQKVVEAHV